MKAILFIIIIFCFFNQKSYAATCRDMKTYLNFTDEMCREVTSLATDMEGKVSDARETAAEHIMRKYEKNKFEIYPGFYKYIRSLNSENIIEKYADAIANLKVNCAKNSRIMIINRLDRANSKKSFAERYVSYFDIDLLDKLKSTGVTDPKCIKAAFMLVGAHNALTHKEKMKTEEANKSINDYKCIHQQNCAPSNQGPRRGQ